MQGRISRNSTWRAHPSMLEDGLGRPRSASESSYWTRACVRGKFQFTPRISDPKKRGEVEGAILLDYALKNGA